MNYKEVIIKILLAFGMLAGALFVVNAVLTELGV